MFPLSAAQSCSRWNWWLLHRLHICTFHHKLELRYARVCACSLILWMCFYEMARVRLSRRPFCSHKFKSANLSAAERLAIKYRNVSLIDQWIDWQINYSLSHLLCICQTPQMWLESYQRYNLWSWDRWFGSEWLWFGRLVGARPCIVI